MIITLISFGLLEEPQRIVDNQVPVKEPPVKVSQENLVKPEQNAVKAEESAVETKPEEPKEDEKVFYNGTKVLRVVIQNKDQKKYIRELENKGGERPKIISEKFYRVVFTVKLYIFLMK